MDKKKNKYAGDISFHPLGYNFHAKLTFYVTTFQVIIYGFSKISGFLYIVLSKNNQILLTTSPTFQAFAYFWTKYPQLDLVTLQLDSPLSQHDKVVLYLWKILTHKTHITHTQDRRMGARNGGKHISYCLPQG